MRKIFFTILFFCSCAVDDSNLIRGIETTTHTDTQTVTPSNTQSATQTTTQSVTSSTTKTKSSTDTKTTLQTITQTVTYTQSATTTATGIKVDTATSTMTYVRVKSSPKYITETVTVTATSINNVIDYCNLPISAYVSTSPKPSLVNNSTKNICVDTLPIDGEILDKFNSYTIGNPGPVFRDIQTCEAFSVLGGCSDTFFDNCNICTKTCGKCS
jgi:hypothetical protein